ncbi:hypothetical protein ciss_16160 [Carboxydothermus islandicus]|uniref:Aldehyde oxidase/xanthine dehydrogenase a/b hammerhead domain-containing protein n=1 Tax=Carboxydothermus islandicus TaxID=661089 RepID=A0A1L8D3D5_9THEO|nr:molybdopterin cofactor-binding domain-containing protein [Carboxydothermus islandicus]GAV25683.1 hypothetical protein ciss_16160 [Carboxydothermus islandicus]
MIKKESYIGKSVKRKDGPEKVTGSAKYVGDLKFGSMLYAKILRSKYAHAKIIRIDTSKAEKLPGVKAVVTGKDFPQRMGLYLLDRTPYAVDKVRYYGEPVAGVAAVSEEIAQKAIELIEVEYEELPAVLDPREGMKEGAPLIHPDLKNYEHVPAIYPKPDTNISNHFKIRKGNVEEGFAKSDYIFEGEYYVPQIQHTPIETHTAIVMCDSTGKFTIWSSNQSPNAVRKILSHSLKIPMTKIRVLGPYCGGGFGAKAGVNIEAPLIPLALKLRNKPIKYVTTREEEFRDTFVRQGMYAKIKTGVTKEGRIVAQELEMVWDAGAYNEYGVNITRAAGYSSAGVYDIPYMKTDSYCVYTNKPNGGPLRGFGMSEMHWAIEQHMDMIAHKLGMDPIEFRLKNIQRDGSTNATGQVLKDVGIEKCILRAKELIGWEEIKGEPKPELSSGKVRAKGLACMIKAPAMPNNAASSAIVKFNDDGTVALLITAQEIGQGAFTALAQICAEELGVPEDWIKVSQPDTDYTAYEWQTVASRITYSAGNAVIRAARDAKRQLLEMGAKHFGVPLEELDVYDGYVYVVADPARKIAVKDIALGLTLPDGSGWGGPVIGKGVFIPEGVVSFDKETGQSPKGVSHWTYGVQAVDIEVDVDTGKIDVKKVVAVYDIGKVINPDLAKAQTEGGIIQGLSTALFEEMKFDEKGKLLNPSFVDYKIATAAELPEMIIDFIETPLEDGPYGARGFGEHVMVPTAPAIANALYNALGIRINTLPLTAEKVRKAIKEKYGI